MHPDSYRGNTEPIFCFMKTSTIRHSQDPSTKNKKNYQPVSRILSISLAANVAIIYLLPSLLSGCFCLPRMVPIFTRVERTALRPILYMAFQHPRFTRTFSYLPVPQAFTLRFHLFSSAWGGRVVIFCGTFSFTLCSMKPAIHRQVVLCWPDFPPPRQRRKGDSAVGSYQLRVQDLTKYQL